MTISFRVSPEEEKQIRNYAEYKGVRISTFRKDAVFDHMKLNLI